MGLEGGGGGITVALTTEGLEDMLNLLLLHRRPWCQDGRTWVMIQVGREVRSHTDYILVTDRRLFWNVSVWDPRYNSDHSLFMGCLRSAPLSNTLSTSGGASGSPSDPWPP